MRRNRQVVVSKCYAHTDCKQGKVKLDLNLSLFLMLTIMLVLRKPSGLSHSPAEEKPVSVLIPSQLNGEVLQHMVWSQAEFVPVVSLQVLEDKGRKAEKEQISKHNFPLSP